MMQGLYASSTGMQTHSKGMGIVGNNLANANTIGFKQQLMLFDNLGSKYLPGGSGYELEVRQMGMGSSIGYIRTLFTPGAPAVADNMTDLAISGKGYFQVSDGNEEFYTRAGNFHFDFEGTLRTPDNKHAVSGIPIINGVETGQLTDINIGVVGGEMSTSPSKITSQITSLMNVYTDEDRFTDADNPYFAMMQSWDGTKSPPISGGKSLALQYYDSKGVRRDLEIRLDKAPATNGEQVYEYVVVMDPKLDARAGYANTKSAGLLMSGTLTFSPGGELKNMSSFSPTGGDLTSPEGWTLSTLAGGSPSVGITLPGQAPQNIKLNFGVTGGNDGWVTNAGDAVAGVTADTIGTDFTSLPGMSAPTYSPNATTALAGSTSVKDLKQDGHPVGDLSTLHIDSEGVLHARYTNGQSDALYRIPIFRFTSEDGLRREGGNFYSYTDEAGDMEHGVAGTENYGTVHSYHLEQSNVDMSREMVNMIIVQRGFQSNSKSMTTIDTMIQKAIEMKR